MPSEPGSPSVGGAGGREWEGRQTGVGARCQLQLGLSAAAAGVSVTDAAYATTVQCFTSQVYLAQAETENRMGDRRKRERAFNSIIEYSIIV